MFGSYIHFLIYQNKKSCTKSKVIQTIDFLLKTEQKAYTFFTENCSKFFNKQKMIICPGNTFRTARPGSTYGTPGKL